MVWLGAKVVSVGLCSVSDMSEVQREPGTTAMSRGLTLACLREAELARQRAEVEILRFAELLARTSPSQEPPLIDGVELDMPFGGEGTTPAGQFVVSAVAVAMGITEHAAFSLLADAVELVQRLPRTWARIEMGAVEPWRGRRIARATRELSPEAVALVDARVAAHAGGIGPRTLAALVAATAAECGETERLAPSSPRRVQVRTGLGAAEGYVEGVVDAADAARFDAELTRIATELARRGDEGSLDERRAKAVGVMASPEMHLALVNGDEVRPSMRPPLVLHVTMTEAALAGAEGRVVDVERLGPQLLEQVRAWAGHSHVSLSPVVDTETLRPVSSYHVPARMREAVEHRNPTCVFPWCERSSRGRGVDLDHIEPFEPGRKGQTSVANLAPLCRRHHRMKTHGGWQYRRLGASTYV